MYRAALASYNAKRPLKKRIMEMVEPTFPYKILKQETFLNGLDLLSKVSGSVGVVQQHYCASSSVYEQVVPNANDYEQLRGDDDETENNDTLNSATLDKDNNGDSYQFSKELLQLSKDNNDDDNNNNLSLYAERKDGQPETFAQNAVCAPAQVLANQSIHHHHGIRNDSSKVLSAKYNLLLSEVHKQLKLNGQLGDHCVNHYAQRLLAKDNRVHNVNSLPALIEDKQQEVEQTIGFRINFPKPGEMHPSHLHQMIMAGNVDAVKELVAQGADVHARNSKGLTPLHLCIWAGGHKYLEMVKILVSHGADINATSILDKPLLLLAAEKGKGVTDLEQLVNLGAHFKATDGAGDTILHYLARNGDVKSLEYFIFLGASVHAVNKFDNTPLHAAVISCKENFTETVRALALAIQRQRPFIKKLPVKRRLFW